METPQVKSEHFERLGLPDLYDILAEQTVSFNKMLLQKSSKEEMSVLKSSIKEIQKEIQRRKESEV